MGRGAVSSHGGWSSKLPGRGSIRWRPGAVSLLVFALCCAASCGADRGEQREARDIEPGEPLFLFVGAPLRIDPIRAASAILIEPETNAVLYEQNAHEPRSPASLVKIMLELVTLNEIEAGRLSLDDSVATSAYASRIGGSQVYLAEGERFPVRDLLRAVSIHSANDACVALAEHITGSAEGFVMLMNATADHHGLEDTRFANVHGLDINPQAQNVSTARDISQMGRELIRYPGALERSSTEMALFRNGEFEMRNRNSLVGRFPGLDGVKTGFTNRAGHCLCATAVRNDMRLISVVMGANSSQDRFRESARLLSAGFSSYLPYRFSEFGDTLESSVAIPGGSPGTVAAIADRSVTLLVSRPDERDITTEFVPRTGLAAPLEAGDTLGICLVRSGVNILAEIPAVSPEPVARTGIGPLVRRIFGG